MVVDAVKNWDDGKPAEVDREDGFSMIFVVGWQHFDAVGGRVHELCGGRWSIVIIGRID